MNPPQDVSKGRAGHATGASAGVDLQHQYWTNEDGRADMLLLVHHPATSGAWTPSPRCVQYFRQPMHQHLCIREDGFSHQKSVCPAIVSEAEQMMPARLMRSEEDCYAVLADLTADEGL